MNTDYQDLENEKIKLLSVKTSGNLRPNQFNVIYFDYIGKQEKSGGGRMVNLWMDSNGRTGLE